MSKRTKYLLISAAIVLSALVFVTAILPIIVRNKAVSALKEATGREVHLSSVSINPFTLTVTVSGFAIAEKTGPPLVAFRKATASLALASAYKRALILSELALDAPSVSLIRTAPNRFNFSDIIDRQPKGGKPEQGKPLLFSLNNITVKNGSIDFDDRVAAGARKHAVRNLQLTIPFISNIPYLAERYVDPRLAAVVDGAPFSFAGKLKPLSKSLETSVHIGLKGLNLPQYLAYAPVPPPVALSSGRLTLDMELSYRVSADKKPELILKGGAGLAEVRVDLLDGKPLLRLPALQLKADRLEAFAGSFEFGSIALNGLELFVDRDSKGRWMYDRIVAAKEKPEEPKQAKDEKGKEKTVFAVKSFASSNGTVHFRDALPKGGFSSTVSDLNISLKDFDTRPGRSAGYDLSLLADGNASLKSRGGFTMAPLSVNASMALAGARLGSAWPYLQQYLTAPVQGTVGFSAEILYGEENGLRVQKGDLAISGLSTRYGSKDGFDLATLQVKDASFLQNANRLEVGEVRLSKGSLSLSREADGSLSPLSLLAQQPKRGPAPPTRVSKEAAGKSKAFSYLVRRFQLDGFKLAFADKTYEEPPRFTLRNTNLTLSNLQGPKFAPMPINFASNYGKGAALKARGTLTPVPFRYQGMLSVGRLPIRDFEPYFPDSFNFSVIGGSADLSLNLDVAARNGRVTGRFRGSAGVRDFHSIDTVADQDLLKWESLQFDEFQGDLEPFSLSIRQVALNDVYSRIIIRKDGSLNLQDLVKEEAPQQAAAQPAAVQQATATQQQPAASAAASAVTVKAQSPSTPAPPRRQVSVGSVTIQNGTLSFTDNHLPQTFNSTFYNLGGRVSGLSSEESKFADVDLRGNLENHSPMQITGRLNPLRDDLFVDLKVSFKDIELSPVTPYSGTYLGYEIDKGKLFLDLKYLIEKKQLSSENRIFVDQFTFGRKVDSNQATNLPVRLAIALLKDRKGEIHLDLPVTGRTDDPQFSIWRVVGQVLKNLLVKAATSPFALLSSLTGGGQDFSMVQFEPGSSSLSQGENQKLEKLAKVLADRPGVKMEIKGFVDRAKDPEGYRQELLERKLQHERYLYLVKEQRVAEGESGETVKLSEEEKTRLLKAVYKKERFPKPRNALGLVKDLPANEMRKLIIANTVVAEADLQSLARERSATVFNYLVAKGGLPPERLFQGSEDIYHPPAQESAPRSRVEFNAIAR